MSIGDVIIYGDVFSHFLLDSKFIRSFLWSFFGRIDVTKKISGYHVIAVDLGQSIKLWVTDHGLSSKFSAFLVNEFKHQLTLLSQSGGLIAKN
jgi:hypothetical protein